MADDGSIPSSSRPGTPVAELPSFASTSRQPAYRFAWDSPSRPRGPASVAETTDSRAELFNPLYGQPPTQLLDSVNFSSASLALGSLPPEWTCSNLDVDSLLLPFLPAISTVLNNPHKKADPPKAHAPVPPIIPAILPRVKRKDFDGYLRSIRSEWELFQINLQLGREGSTQFNSDFPADVASPSSTSSSRTQRQGKQIPSLESVPSIYFEAPFNLGNPSTFAAVIEQKGGDTSLDPTSLSHSLPLLEKMSHHADTIELHLIREISIRSASFFAALTNLQDLQTESEQCLERIAKLKQALKEVDDKGAKRGLEVVRLRKRLENLRSAREGVKVVESVGEMVTVTRGLVGAGEWGESLTVIDGLRNILDTSSTQTLLERRRGASLNSGVDTLPSVKEEDTTDVPSGASSSIQISSLAAFSSLPTQLQALTLQIAASLTNDLLATCRSELHTRSERPPSQHEIPNERDHDLRIRLVPLLQGLSRTGSTNKALVGLRAVVLEEVRGCVKRHISASDLYDMDPDAPQRTVEERSMVLQKCLRGQTHPEFLTLVSDMYSTLLRCLEAIHSQNTLIIEILSSDSVQAKEADLSQMQTELADILFSASELANTRASKILTVRAEQHAELEFPSFVMLFNATWNFMVACEVICRKMVVGLRGTLVGQAKAYLNSFHSKHLSQSAKLVEDELWAPVDVTPHFQNIVRTLVDAAVQNPRSLILNVDPSQLPVPNGTTSSVNGNSVGTKVLQIEDRSYFVVSATLHVLPLVVDYIQVIINMPVLTTDTMSRTIEFLKAFNSRTCQVVLGAGAMRSAGLKNITAKHLALASQSLSIMVSLIPYIRETFRRHLSAQQAIMLIEFDKLKRDYQEHQNEIHDKLIAIMNDRLAFHCKSLGKIDWAIAKSQVNEYMEQLVKEAMTLHKVLSKYLPEPPVEYIMTQVFAAINHQLEEEYGKIELPNERAKERLLADTRYLRDKFSSLKAIGGTSGMGMLEVVVSEKRINAPSASSPPPTNNIHPGTPPIPTPASPPPQQVLPQAPSGPTLPSTLRKSPFTGNRRISNLLSSVSAIGKLDKPPSANQIPTPVLPEKVKEKEETLVREAPEIGKISAFQSGQVNDKTLIPQEISGGMRTSDDVSDVQEGFGRIVTNIGGEVKPAEIVAEPQSSIDLSTSLGPEKRTAGLTPPPPPPKREVDMDNSALSTKEPAETGSPATSHSTSQDPDSDATKTGVPVNADRTRPTTTTTVAKDLIDDDHLTSPTSMEQHREAQMVP